MGMEKASNWNLHIVKTCMPMNESYHISSFDQFAHSHRYRVQLRYIRTTHTRIIRAHFVYTRTSMSIRTHMRVYVSLLCIPISFFIWSIHIIFMAMKKDSKRNLHIVKMCMPMNESYHISITSQIHQQTNVSLTLAWS